MSDDVKWPVWKWALTGLIISSIMFIGDLLVGAVDIRNIEESLIHLAWLPILFMVLWSVFYIYDTFKALIKELIKKRPLQAILQYLVEAHFTTRATVFYVILWYLGKHGNPSWLDDRVSMAMLAFFLAGVFERKPVEEPEKVEEREE